jgi:NAD(P)-dependent dehydrogenase (short-subunit alcohol dehydrogenase family)
MGLGTSPSARRVVVTGATGGIGSAIVASLAESGCTIGACDFTPDVESAFEGVAAVAATARFDVRERDATQQAISGLVERLGGCDAVVANAGVVDTIHRAERFPEDEWRKDLDTNLTGQFNVATAAFGALSGSGDGRIVLISSVAAETGLPGQVAYAAAKAGTVGLARTLAGEWGPRGIRCNVVMPGFIATPKVRALPEAMRDALAATVPLRRIGHPDELAATVAFLLSPAAAYINGAVIRVDGGFGLSTGGLMTAR